MNAKPIPATDGQQPPRADHVGVVCVHGIGFQQPGNTLLEWTGPIAAALVDWRRRLEDADIDEGDRDWPRDLIESSDVDRTGERRSYVTFRIPGVKDAKAQRWTFTEAYWAARVDPPSLGVVIDWSGRQGAVGRAVRGILTNNAPKPLKPVVEVAGILWLGLFVSALTSLVLLGYAILRTILAIIPVKAAKDFVQYGQGERFLVGWWGDARSILHDPVQSASVRLSLDAAIEDLRQRGCGRIVVVAHSGGTIVSYMTLSDPALKTMADTLITHGQAIELGRRVEALADQPRSQPQPSVSRIRQVATRDELRVARWRDFYATHDPAPVATPSDLPASPSEGDGYTAVVNLASIRADHGGYWANDEQFVLPILTEIERVGRGELDSPFASRFTRPDPLDGAVDVTRCDEYGVARRESRVAMRSLWGRLSLVGPLVAILFAAGVAAGNIDNAAVLDAPSDILAANYDRLPFHELGTTVSTWVSGTLPAIWQDAAVGVTRGVFFLVFVIAAIWACIPVGGWNRMPRGAALADILTSAAVPVAAVIAVPGLGPIAGIRMATEFWIVTIVALAVIAISAGVYWQYRDHVLSAIPSRLVTSATVIILITSVAAAVIAFIIQEPTRRWVVDVAFAVIAVSLVVRLGMWRWNSWDAAERQWFRGARKTSSSRAVIYAIAVALGLLVVAVVAVLGGLEAPLHEAGVPLAEYLGPATVLSAAFLVLYLVVRDVSTAESAPV